MSETNAEVAALKEADLVLYRVGELTVALSTFDNFAPLLFGMVSRMAPGPGGAAIRSHRYTSQRLKMISTTLAAMNPAPAYADELTAIIKIREDLGERRNRLMHDTWSRDVDGRWLLFRDMVPGKHYPLTHAPQLVDLAELTSMIASAQDASRRAFALLVDDWRRSQAASGEPNDDD